MSRIIVIPDVHASKTWKKIIEKEQPGAQDVTVFLGDYFDDYKGTPAYQQIENFKEIVQYKKTAAGKVVMLLGNHISQYIKNFLYLCKKVL